LKEGEKLVGLERVDEPTGDFVEGVADESDDSNAE
jgi:hypothetical protein